MGERERVDDQKLSTNGGFWTLPPRLLRTSLLFVPEPRLYIYNGKQISLIYDASLSRLEQRPRRTSTRERLQFYNLVLFISSVAIFSLTAQRLSGPKSAR
ncbi:unnamed protein product [Penicillium salamii]|uniref:Uncharacterized protein n=1 Tax=Penicillium salamii TaxID=1612424 RepID=A0A9W4IDX0_9EURO|nr:unnamed protein product [Penicillium salamii]CAG8101141.1 unnamed protein product [Penicillium salamii]CAG8105316.1 unnamed protein product [Penicillium salamii]CAG8117290.1 unnamed protein product [Penicillium salamii]CAG8288536.1 unnamed protein product [Penicillium salamii]